jgi:hypothetical protein
MKRVRKQDGSTVCELLVASLIMTMVSSAFLTAAMTMFKTDSKISTMTDTTDAARLIKDRIGKDMREGRTLGDVFGNNITDESTTPATVMVQGSDQFPCNRNPVYGAGQQPPAGWPTDWPQPPYNLSNQCLVVQVPIGDNHNDVDGRHGWDMTKVGWPTMIAQGVGSPATSSNQDNVETHVYMVRPDPSNPGEFIMQYSSFPGMAKDGYDPVAHSISAQTVLTGIVGPLDESGNPKVFQFVDRTDPNGTPRDTILPQTSPSGAFIANYTGVAVNLEICKHSTVSKENKNVSLPPVAFKTEVYLRNNAMATPIGQSSTVAAAASQI